MFKSFLDDQIISASQPYQDGYIWEEILLRRCDVTTCSVLVRHEALDDTGYFDESLRRHQEIQMLAFLSKKYKIHLLQEYLLFVDAWGENTPSSTRLIQVKEDFYRAVAPLTDSLPKRRQKHIRRMHNFEVAFAFLKEKKIIKCLRYALPLLASPVTVYYALERVLIRQKSKGCVD